MRVLPGALGLVFAATGALAQPAGWTTPSSPNTLYFYSWIKHFEPRPQTNETLKWIGYSRTLERDKWRFVTGAATYVDSYSVRSYGVFSDISHDDFRIPLVRPALSLQCHYKGRDYDSKERQFYCFPVPKLKFGTDNYFMVKLAGLPKLGDITNGWVSLEFGFQW